MFPNLEESWEISEKVIRDVVGSHELCGMPQLKEQWKREKSNLLELFGKDGRILSKVDRISGDTLTHFKAEIYALFQRYWVNPPEDVRNITSQELMSNKKVIGKQSVKLSKHLSGFIPEESRSGFNSEFSMITQKAKQVGTLVVSINPLDILLMSHHGIRSCHRLTGGEYRGGTMGYLVDKHTAVCFLTNSIRDLCIDDSIGVQYPWKIWRQLCFIDRDNHSAAFMRQYPNGNDDAYAQARKMVAYALRIDETGWLHLKEADVTINNTGLAYVDPVIGVIKLKTENADLPHITLDKLPTCPMCGLRYVENSSRILCDYCNDQYICCECGGYANNPHWVDENPYCDDCFDGSYCYCADCGEIFGLDDIERYDGTDYCADCLDNFTYRCDVCGERELDTLGGELNNGDLLCSYCVNSRVASECIMCGEYFYTHELEELGGELYCPYCYDKNAVSCTECGEHFVKGDLTEFQNDLLCPDCYDDIVVICSECGLPHYEEDLFDEGYCEKCFDTILEYLLGVAA